MRVVFALLLIISVCSANNESYMNKDTYGDSKMEVKYIDYYQGTGTLKEYNDKHPPKEIAKKKKQESADPLAKLFNFFDQVLQDFGVKVSKEDHHTGNRRNLGAGFLQ